MLNELIGDDKLYIMEEEDIFAMSKQLDGEDNNFRHALHVGHMYKMVGLTPLYMYDVLDQCIVITSQEKYDNKLH